mmetsp:Transcript_20467/g.25178  ORF Transcript_20467/g.25178 Transcript_20467/m.25178 type:complete len:256 (+) Transcript_20467:1308-2075(+)
MVKDTLESNLRSELTGMLREPVYLECFMRRVPLKPIRPNHKTQLLFVFFFIFVIASQFLVVLPKHNNIYLAFLIATLSPCIALSFFIASAKDPGYLRPSHDFLDLLSKIHPIEMCPDCLVLRTPRSRHCAICNRCVERFDHHCPWLNNCVGVRNNNAFLVFLVSLSTCLLSILASCVETLTFPCSNEHSLTECPLEELCMGCQLDWLRYTVISLSVFVTLFFCLPVMFLCWVQVNNYRLNKTSNERFAKSTRTRS